MDVQEALLRIIGGGNLRIQLPAHSVEEAFRRSRGLFAEEIKALLRNGEFPYDRVVSVMDDHTSNWRAANLAEMRAYVDSLRILQACAQLPDGSVVSTGLQHKDFPTLLKVLQAKQNAYLVGPAGSGKTKAAQQASEVLSVPFYFTGAITSEYKLTGFRAATGKVVRTAFREAFEHGGLFLFDEIDGSMAAPVLAFNAAIANGIMDFPDGTVKKHPNFYCVAAANTFGVGADRVYVGRNQLDGATLDRYAFIEWSYDEDLERAITLSVTNEWEPETVNKWVNHVQDVRAAVADIELHHIISPRASIEGVNLLRIGIEWNQVVKMKLWKGLDEDSVQRITEILGNE